MSLQAFVRFENETEENDWESNLFGYAYDAFEVLSDDFDIPNPHSFAWDEIGELEAETDALEAELDDDVDEDEFEEQMEAFYASNGEWFEADELRECLEPLIDALRDHDGEFTLDGRRACDPEDLADDLETLLDVVEGDGRRFRIVVG